MIRPTRAVEAIPVTTPFIGPEQLMRETGHHELVRLGANESAFGPSPKAIKAMSAELERLAWYGDPDSLDLRDRLADKHRCRPHEILVGAGIDDLMGLTVRAFVGPGDPALALYGTYPTFNYHVVGHGGRPLSAPYRNDGRPDLDALLALAKRERAPVLYLANPDNPSGAFVGRADMTRFYEALPPETLFLLDEAYADFADAGELLPEQLDDRLIRMRTFSKAYGMAGARIGYAIATERNLQTLGKLRLQYGVNRNAQVGALASLDDDEFRRYVVRETAAARDEYYRLAAELGCGAIESYANFVCIDMGSKERAASVMEELLRRGVWIRKPGAAPLDRYVRVSAGTAPMRAAFAEALRAVLAEAAA